MRETFLLQLTNTLTRDRFYAQEQPYGTVLTVDQQKATRCDKIDADSILNRWIGVKYGYEIDRIDLRYTQ